MTTLAGLRTTIVACGLRFLARMMAAFVLHAVARNPDEPAGGYVSRYHNLRVQEFWCRLARTSFP